MWFQTAIGIVVIGVCSFAFAQSPLSLPGTPKEAEKSAQGGESPQTAMIELQAKRAKAEAELKEFTESRKTKTPSTQDQFLEKRALHEQIVRGYDEQIDDYQRLKEAEQRLAEVTQANNEWTGFSESPPYSIFLIDQLWDAAFSLRLTAEGLQSQLNLIELRFDRAREALATAEERLRQASERLEAISDPAESARQKTVRDEEELRRRVAAVMVTAAETDKKRVEAEIAETRARVTFAERQLEIAQQHVGITEEDADKVRKRLSQERRALEGELERIMVEERAQAQALQATERQEEPFAKRPSASSKKSAQKSARAKMAVELQRAQLDTLIVKADLLKQLLDVVEGERRLWERRLATMLHPGSSMTREGSTRFAPLFANFRASRDYLRQQLVVVSGQISESENRLRNASGREERSLLEGIVQAYRQRESAYSRSLQRMDQAARFLEHWKSESKEQRHDLPWSVRLNDSFQRTWTAVKDAWSFEVFSAEDTIEVDGQKITGHRSVTVGKIASALILLIAGYWACLYLAKLIGRMAITRLGVSAGVANLLRQWSQAVMIMMVILVSLVLVKIPLTIFAFLGGALAIGVGFGAQNLLKNVISGILVLIERPLRVGDLIEVDNVRGHVTTIGLRSSTVRDTKGMETLIPNSSFLERHLTNWTYSSQQSRFSLRLGAPYGSPTHDLIKLLVSAASENPQILKTPPPQVFLEEFGAQARIFTINYWLEIRLDVDPNEVASELRFAIEEKFSQAGLKVLPAA